jgi:hypothetical protein
MGRKLRRKEVRIGSLERNLGKEGRMDGRKLDRKLGKEVRKGRNAGRERSEGRKAKMSKLIRIEQNKMEGR